MLCELLQAAPEPGIAVMPGFGLSELVDLTRRRHPDRTCHCGFYAGDFLQISADLVPYQLPAFEVYCPFVPVQSMFVIPLEHCVSQCASLLMVRPLVESMRKNLLPLFLQKKAGLLFGLLASMLL